MAATKNWDVILGDTFERVCTYRVKSTQVPIDLTGATITGFVTKDGQQVTMTGYTTSTPGQFGFGFSSAQITSLGKGIYPYQVKITFSNSTVKTLLVGNLVVS